MCDTIYLKENNDFYIGKNSDRSPNEAHIIIRIPHLKHSETTLRVTYIEIPQVQETYQCILFKPASIWGAEMGYNEFGLNIANEALFSKGKKNKNNSLIGMDLLRLALERCKTSIDAVNLIINLLQKYGQGGNCGFDKNFYYDNSFLICDGKETYLLETSKKHFAYKKINDNKYAISNCFSIMDDYDQSDEKFSNFKKQFQDNFITKIACAEKRKKTSLTLLSSNFDPFIKMIMTLRSHSKDNINIKTSSTSSVCMHAGNFIGDQCTGSYIGKINQIYFATGSSYPCISMFKPISPKGTNITQSELDALKYWVKLELVHRHIMSNNINETFYKENILKLENKYLNLALKCQSNDELENISRMAFQDESNFINQTLRLVINQNLDPKGNYIFNRYYDKKNQAFIECYNSIIKQIYEELA